MTSLSDKSSLFVFLFVFPLGGIGSIFSNFGYDAFNIMSSIRALGYISGCAFFILYLFNFFINDGKVKLNHISVVFSVLFFFLVFFIQVGFNYNLFGPTGGGEFKNALSVHIPIFLTYLSMLYLGFYWISLSNKKIVVLSWCLYTCSIYFFVDFHTLSLDFMQLRNPSDRSFILMLSDSYVLTTLTTLAFLRKSNFKFILVFGLGLISLFFISSRTALLLYLLSVFVYYSVIGSVRLKVLVVIILIPFILWSFYFLQSNATGYSARLFEFSSSDDSLVGRENMLNSGIKKVLESPIIGDFGGQVRVSLDQHGERWGAYIHNSVSYFRQFGILGLFFVLYLYFLSVVIFYKAKIRNELNCYRIIFMPCIYIVLATILSRSYVYPWLFLIPGFYISSTKRYSH